MFKYTVKDILAVVVIYNTSLEKSESLLSLEHCRTGLDVLVYDNSPHKTDFWSFEHININYFHNPLNPGVSAAYNYAAGFARAHNKQFLLLLDQDTKLPYTAITTYLEAINKHTGCYLFAPKLIFAGKIFSPCRYVFKRGSHFRRLDPGIHRMKNTSFLNSGLLINLSLFEKTGDMMKK